MAAVYHFDAELLDFTDALAEAEAAELVESLQRCDCVALLHVLMYAGGLRLCVHSVFIFGVYDRESTATFSFSEARRQDTTRKKGLFP